MDSNVRDDQQRSSGEQAPGGGGESTGRSKFVVYAALAANAGVAIIKFFAAAFTGSSSMLSEGIHSTVDTADQALLLLGMHRSKRPPDEMHPFGHGKEVYFWSLIVAMLIFGVGGGISVYEGILHILHESKLEDPTWNYWVLGIAAVFELASLVVGVREFLRAKPAGMGFWTATRKSKDPTVFTVVFEDSAAVLGVGVAFCGVFLSHRLETPWLDGVASIVIGLILAAVAIFLAYESKNLLIGESATIDDVRDIRRIAEDDPAVDQADYPMTMQLSPHEALLNLGLHFTAGQSLADVEAAVNRIESKIRRKHPEIKRVFIEAQSLQKSQ